MRHHSWIYKAQPATHLHAWYGQAASLLCIWQCKHLVKHTPRRFDSTDKEVNSVVEIPGDAKMLEKQFPGVVKVLAPRKDFGPATKLLPTLEVETDPETIIIKWM
jgi:hypothetical protein